MRFRLQAVTTILLVFNIIPLNVISFKNKLKQI